MRGGVVQDQLVKMFYPSLSPFLLFLSPSIGMYITAYSHIIILTALYVVCLPIIDLIRLILTLIHQIVVHIVIAVIAQCTQAFYC